MATLIFYDTYQYCDGKALVDVPLAGVSFFAEHTLANRRQRWKVTLDVASFFTLAQWSARVALLANTRGRGNGEADEFPRGCRLCATTVEARSLVGALC